MAAMVGARVFGCQLSQIFSRTNQNICALLTWNKCNNLICRSLERRTYCSAVSSASLVSSATQTEAEVVKSSRPSDGSEEAAADALYEYVTLECKGVDKAVLDSYEQFVRMAAQHLDVPVVRVWAPRFNWYMRTLLKSKFVHKDHRVQYEIRTHYRCVLLKHVTGSTADTFLEYIQRNLPESVALKVTTEELRRLPAHIQPGSENTQPQQRQEK